MRPLFLLVSLGVILMGFALLGVRAADTTATGTGPIKVLIVDGYSNHDWR